MGSVSAIAKDTNGKSSIEAAYFENEPNRIKAAVIFTTPEARAAVENIEQHRLRLRAADHTNHDRVLMVFTQSNIKTPPKEKRSGEKVVIEEISRAELPLIYASDLAEEKNGRPVAYKVVNLHQVIDLGETDDISGSSPIPLEH